MEPCGLEPGPGMPEAVWRRFLALCEVVERDRRAISQGRRLTPAVEQAFRDADLYRLLVPTDLGGAGLGPLQQFDMAARLAFHDASAGWNLAVGPAMGYFSGYMPRAQAEAMYARECAAIAGSAAPQGRAIRVEGGYRVSGRFAWASGIDQAEQVYGGCFVVSGGEQELLPDGRPRMVIVFAPKSAAKVHDCWSVSGLVATNSTEFSLEDQFVPDDRVVHAALDQVYHEAPLFRLPMTVFGFALTGVPIGVARRAVEGLKELALNKNSPQRGRLADNAFAQYAVAKAEALVEAGQSNVRRAFEALWQEAQGEAPCSMATRARVRRASVHAAESCQEAVMLCYRAAGGSALFASEPFEAALRDVNAICGHVVFQRAMMEDAGRVAFGLPTTVPVF